MAQLPEGYTVPSSGADFFSFADGVNQFRIVSDPVMGYQYWNADNKPVNLTVEPKLSEMINPQMDAVKDKNGDEVLDADGNPVMEARKPAHFWACLVLVREGSNTSLQMAQITQRSVQTGIMDLYKDPDWGDFSNYDIKVTKTGSGLLTKYSVLAAPHKELTEDEQAMVDASEIDINALLFPDKAGDLDKLEENGKIDIIEF